MISPQALHHSEEYKMKGTLLQSIIVFGCLLHRVFGLVDQPSSQQDIREGQILFLGDSIIQGWIAQGQPAGWGGSYARFGAVMFPELEYTSDLLRMLTDETHDYIELYKPYVYVIMVGTNDLAAGLSEHSVATNIGRIVQVIQKRGVVGSRVILLGILPRGDPALHEKIRTTNALIDYEVGNAGIYYIDMESEFATGLGAIIPSLYLPDGIQLSTEGFRVWNTLMSPAFSEAITVSYPGKVVMMGDFLLDELPTTAPTVWTNLQFYKTINLAVSHHTSWDTWDRINDQGVLDGLCPKAVILLIGSNDIISGTPIPTIIDNVVNILNKFRELFPHVSILVQGVPPMVGVPPSVSDRIKELNSELDRVRGEKTWFYDLGRAFTDADGAPLPGYYQSDGVHLAEVAYGAWSRETMYYVNQFIKFEF